MATREVWRRARRRAGERGEAVGCVSKVRAVVINSEVGVGEGGATARGGCVEGGGHEGVGGVSRAAVASVERYKDEHKILLVLAVK